MGIFDKKIGPVFLKETSDATKYIEKMEILKQKQMVTWKIPLIKILYLRMHIGERFNWRTLRNYIYEIDSLAYHNLEEVKKIFNALIDLEICYVKNYGIESDEAIVKQWIELFLILRNRDYGLVGEILWLWCLLYFFRWTCSDSNESTLIEHDLVEEWEKVTSQMIKETNAVVENVIGNKIYNIPKNMMYCCKRSMEKDTFDSKISGLVNALKKMDTMKKYWDKKDKKCIAVMHSNAKRYVALSGSESVNIYTTRIRELLGTEYEVIELNSNVRYYHTKNAYITYEQYKEWSKIVNFDEKEVPEARRMFSCCERKLLTKLYAKSNSNYTMYVKLKPCPMCRIALDDYDIKQGSKGLIKYPVKDYAVKKRKSIKNKLNEIAKEASMVVRK